MKKFLFAAFCAVCIGTFLFPRVSSFAQVDEKIQGETNFVSPNLVISQFQPGGGTANDEFIEIHNNGAAPVDLLGYKLVYRSSSGTNDLVFFDWTASAVIPAGGYYLVASTSYDGGVTANATYNNTTCSCALSQTAGGLAIRQGAANTGTIIDSLGWGAATNAFVETATATAPAANDSKVRGGNGCTDTDNNSNDFTTLTPAAARNSSTAPNTCSGGGTTLFVALAANPTTVAPEGTTLLTATVIPATTPPSTGITATANLTNVGGSATQQLFDDGTNGDVTAADNVFSYTYTIPAATAGGTYSVSATANDAEARTATSSININVNAPVAGEDPLILGNPTNAVSDINAPTNYLMIKPQYSLSYHRDRGIPNWVAWRLDSTWIGTAPRQDDYRGDTSLPSGWYQVQDNDYSGSGYDRGHMCPSGDRTRSIPDNSATFLMTNFVPQLSANNQGPWNDFENYCRSLAQSGNELYIFTGGQGTAGTIASGHVTIPMVTWKVVLVLPNGSNDLSRVSKRTRTIAIIVPNQPPVVSSTPWENYQVTVDKVEHLTGYNFFSNVPKNTQELIERNRK